VSIFFTPRARTRVREISAWWRANRPEAPNLFDEELEAAQLHIVTEAHLSSPWRVVRGMLIRRVLLEKTRQWLYYSVESDSQIIVHTVWGAQRGSEPELG
jgi:hypothetical protein